MNGRKCCLWMTPCATRTRWKRKDKEWFEAFPAPAWCSSKLQAVEELEEQAATRGEEMVQVIQWLKAHWANGYQIYADIDPIEDDEWD